MLSAQYGCLAVRLMRAMQHVRWQDFRDSASLLPYQIGSLHPLPNCRQVLSEQVGSIVGRLVDATQLCIAAGKAAWLAYLDIYILDAGEHRYLQSSVFHGIQLLCVEETRFDHCYSHRQSAQANSCAL